MKKLLIGLVCLGVLSFSVFAQGNRSTRPRVAATPTPAPPTIQNDSQISTQNRRPPVLIGDSKRTTQPPVTSPTPSPKEDEGDVIRIDTNLITMPVSVLDRDGRFVSGLQQKDFRVFENGVEQQIGFFQSVEQPFTVILMIDVSPSTQFQIDEIHQGAIAFVNQLRPNDRVMVIAFDERVRILSEPTNNKNQLRNAIRMADFGDGTGLYEAVDQVINRELRRIEGRKAVVLFTDGVDTTSRRANYQSTVRDVEESDALFYPIRYNTARDNYGQGGYGYPQPQQRRRARTIDEILGAILSGGQFPSAGGGGGGGGASRQEYETGRRYLETLAQNSGGRKFEADTTHNLEAAFAGVAEELRRQYSIGYYPENVGQRGDRKQIKIRVMRPNLIVKAKTSYIVGEGGGQFAGN